MKLEAQNIKMSFGEMDVIKDISVTLNEGEFVSVLGLSGSGKSTLFNIVAGLYRPDAGRVMIDGADVTGQTGHVSYMYQKDLLMPWYRIIDNTALPLMIRGMSKEKARGVVHPYFKPFGLEGFEQSYPFQFSGGMRQRAALLRTYMFSKDIMLLDEPFGGLDAITKRKMHYWLMDVLLELKTSVMFITHDIDEAVFLSDRVYILTDRPSTIKEEIIISLPHPRTKEVTQSQEYIKYKNHITNVFNL